MEIKIMLLVIFSALLHSAWNVLLKKQPDTPAGSVAIAILACLYALFFGLPNIQTIGNYKTALYTIMAGAFAGGALWAQGLAFRSGNLGLIYAVNRAGAIFLLWPISVLLLGENASIYDIFGVGLLSYALIAIMTEGKKMNADKSLSWAAIGAIFIVGYNVCYKMAITSGGDPIAVLGASDVLRVSIAFLLLSGDRVKRVTTAILSNKKEVLAMSVFSFGSFGIFLYALQFEGAAHLGTLRNLSILFTAFGSYSIGESLSKKHVLMIVLSIIGVILIGV